MLKEHSGEITPGVWHYNMGTVYGKMGQLPLARYHLLMAREEGYTKEEAAQNTDIIESRLETSTMEKPTSASDYALKAGMLATEGVFTTIGLIFIIAGIITVWRKSSYRVWLSLFGISLAVLSINWWIISLDKFIVLQPKELHEGPSVIFPGQGEVPPGIFIMATSEGDWKHVYYPSRFSGWIKNADLKELK